MKWDLALSFISGEVGPGLKDFITSELGPSLKIYLVNWYLVLKGGEGGVPICTEIIVTNQLSKVKKK